MSWGSFFAPGCELRNLQCIYVCVCVCVCVSKQRINIER